jgi:hypothetical protein
MRLRGGHDMRSGLILISLLLTAGLLLAQEATS